MIESGRPCWMCGGTVEVCASDGLCRRCDEIPVCEVCGGDLPDWEAYGMVAPDSPSVGGGVCSLACLYADIDETWRRADERAMDEAEHTTAQGTAP